MSIATGKNIFSADLSKIDKVLAGEPKFRVKQAGQLIWRDLIKNWDEAITLPIELRKKLKTECPLEIRAQVSVAKDKQSAKALIALEDGLSVETVLMRHNGRNTVCVSSQIGCPLACVFCATGKMGFKRNLTAGEIMEQVLFWARWLKKKHISHSEGEARRISRAMPAGRQECKADIKSEILPPPRRGQDDKKENKNEKVSNIVFMGMGEPFLNYDNVFEAIKILNDDSLLGIGARHISVSTAGIVEGIERMAEDMPQINLAISLHAPNDELRQKLMPINKRYPLKALMAAAKDYVAKTNRKLMFEYILIKGVNDSVKQAKELAGLLDNRLYFVNLIVYNQTGDLKPSDALQTKRFKDVLMGAGIQALERYRFGQDIKGACGQLVAQKSR